MKRIVLGALVAAILAAPASAAAVLNDNFDTDTVGTRGGNGALANWNATDGTFDLLAQNDYNLPCAGGSGRCIDLDGGTSNGATLRTKSWYSFGVGDLVKLTFELAGSQRGTTESFAAGFAFQSLTTVQDVSRGGAWAFPLPQPPGGLSSMYSYGTVANSSPYQTYTYSFTAATAGALRAVLFTNSNDNVGPLLDNVRLDIGAPIAAVPEPAPWAVLVVGIGLMGAFRRKRAAGNAKLVAV